MAEDAPAGKLRIAAGGRVWVSEPALVPSPVLVLAGHGIRPIRQVAVDGTWSALRFRPLGRGEAQFTGGR